MDPRLQKVADKMKEMIEKSGREVSSHSVIELLNHQGPSGKTLLEQIPKEELLEIIRYLDSQIHTKPSS